MHVHQKSYQLLTKEHQYSKSILILFFFCRAVSLTLTGISDSITLEWERKIIPIFLLKKQNHITVQLLATLRRTIDLYNNIYLKIL